MNKRVSPEGWEKVSCCGWDDQGGPWLSQALYPGLAQLENWRGEQPLIGGTRAEQTLKDVWSVTGAGKVAGQAGPEGTVPFPLAQCLGSQAGVAVMAGWLCWSPPAPTWRLL